MNSIRGRRFSESRDALDALVVPGRRGAGAAPPRARVEAVTSWAEKWLRPPAAMSRVLGAAARLRSSRRGSSSVGRGAEGGTHPAMIAGISTTTSMVASSLFSGVFEPVEPRAGERAAVRSTAGFGSRCCWENPSFRSRCRFFRQRLPHSMRLWFLKAGSETKPEFRVQCRAWRQTLLCKESWSPQLEVRTSNKVPQ